MIGRRVFQARTPRPCPTCGKPILPGDEVVRSITQADDRVYSSWECLRCSAAWEAAMNAEFGYCPTEPREWARDEAKNIGWREWLKEMRAAVGRVRKGL